MRRPSRKRKTNLAADLMLAPMVIGMRMPLMMIEAGKSNGMPGKESTLAITEKMSAVATGMMEAQLSVAASMMRFWPDVMSGRVPSLFSPVGWERAMVAALTPAGGAVRANYARLAKART
jgi:hypothetical protein